MNDTFDGYWRFQIDCGADLCSYATHLKRWQAAFGKSRVLVLFYEDLSSNPQGYLDAVCDFIGARRIALDRSRVGSAKVYSAPAAARSSAIARRTVEADRLGFSPRRASIDRARPAYRAVEDHAAAIRRGVPAAQSGIG